MRETSVSFTELNVSAAWSACSLISSAICTSRSKSAPFCNSDRRLPTRFSRSSATCSTSFIDAIHPPLSLALSQQAPERPQLQVEVLVLEAELRFQLVHALGELHERLAHPIDLVVGEHSFVHPPQRLAFHQLPQELDERQDKLCETTLDRLRVGADARRERIHRAAGAARNTVEVAGRPEELRQHGVVSHASPSANEYGAQGPVHVTESLGHADASSTASPAKPSTEPAGTRYEASRMSGGAPNGATRAAFARRSSG